jgi:hypothetical protein
VLPTHTQPASRAHERFCALLMPGMTRSTVSAEPSVVKLRTAVPKARR